MLVFDPNKGTGELFAANREQTEGQENCLQPRVRFHREDLKIGRRSKLSWERRGQGIGVTQRSIDPEPIGEGRILGPCNRQFQPTVFCLRALPAE